MQHASVHRMGNQKSPHHYVEEQVKRKRWPFPLDVLRELEILYTQYRKEWKYEVWLDEVLIYHRDHLPLEENLILIARFPFVPGYFLCRLVEEENISTHVIAGPFKLLKVAKIAYLLLR